MQPVTEKSKAAGFPRAQLGRKTSAGLLAEELTRAGASNQGAKAADCAAGNRTSPMPLCQAILSPRVSEELDSEQAR